MSGIAARRASALLLLMMMMMMLAACGGLPKKPSPPPLAKTGQASVPPASPGSPRKVSPYAPAQEDPEKRGDYTRGGLYAPHIADSAPTAPIDVDAIPEPDVVDEPLAKYGNRSPYTVIGKSYRVRDTAKGYNETGTASYYGNKFHGRRTSNQEVYDMYAFTAAHRTLPLPSFARVTHLDSGKSVVVRVNDRGPFHDGRLIDLSYAAAVKLGIHPRGTGRVEVVGLSPGERPLPSAARQDAATSARAANASHTPPASLASHTIANGALTLPPGVRIATGKPQPMPPTAIDRLVHALPIATAAAAERDPAPQASPPRAEPLPASAAAALATAATATAATAATAPGSDLDWRFDMRRDGHAMTADQFDAWMTSRRARVATGKAGPPDPYG
ncbi:MAG: septal ring lytic transglycosylase RlpA family protein, partial [Luteimonas sp.]